MSRVLVDIVCVVGWLMAVWVCVYDWDDVAEMERRRSARREQSRMMTRMWQKDGKTEREDIKRK